MQLTHNLIAAEAVRIQYVWGTRKAADFLYCMNVPLPVALYLLIGSARG